MAGSVLVVDGDPEMRDLFVEVLALDGHTIYGASSVGEALGETFPSEPQVILLDAKLAKTDDDIPALGAPFGERWPESEIVYLADASRPRVKRRLERSRVRHFGRPFQIEDLRSLVTEIMERKAHDRR